MCAFDNKFLNDNGVLILEHNGYFSFNEHTEFIDFGVDEVIKDEDGEVILYSSFENYGSIQKELENQGIEIISSEFERIPKQMKELSEEKKE